MCSSGNAEITASKLFLPNVQQTANWQVYTVFFCPEDCCRKLTRLGSNDVARTAGKIFDSCWRSDDTLVGSEVCVTNNRMQVNIRGL